MALLIIHCSANLWKCLREWRIEWWGYHRMGSTRNNRGPFVFFNNRVKLSVNRSLLDRRQEPLPFLGQRGFISVINVDRLKALFVVGGIILFSLSFHLRERALWLLEIPLAYSPFFQIELILQSFFKLFLAVDKFKRFSPNDSVCGHELKSCWSNLMMVYLVAHFLRKLDYVLSFQIWDVLFELPCGS